MASKKLKSCRWGNSICTTCPPLSPRCRPTDSERLGALLRWGKSVELRVWVLQAWRNIHTRRDIDKLLREEGRRAK